MDLKQIKQIIDLMKRSDLSEFALEEEGFKIKIRRGPNGLPLVTAGPISSQHHAISPSSTPSAGSSAPSNPGAPVAGNGAAEEEAGVSYVKSPMVGTFYRSASPESKPFVEVDAKVADNSVVCIIEAMKIMNEIQAETSGVIVEALVENGQPVEYGQRLFKVKKG